MRENIDDVRRQWDAFRHGTTSGLKLRLPIVRSWQRCWEAGVSGREPGGQLVAVDRSLEAHLAANRALLGAAAPVLAGLKESLRDSNQVLVLCDAQARALLIEGDTGSVRKAERVNLVPGSDWSEHVSGTNAMGTALAEASTVTVFATEHYLEDLHPWACVAAPIMHPVTGKPTGVLDLSGQQMVISRHTEMAVLSAVQAIQSRLAVREASLHEMLLAALSDRVVTHRHGSLGVVDRHGILLRMSGMPLPYAPAWSHSMERLLRGEEEYTEVLPDSSGLRLTYRPVRFDGEIIGALVESSRPGTHASAPEPVGEFTLPGLVGHDPRWLAAVERAAKGARTDSTVLLSGETGTGKEVVAKAIHQASNRSKGPFVAMNCGALTPSLAASELFGYVGGAFTGANPRGHAGVFEQAHGGTLFLDEVSELTPESQVALLRVLQEREVIRVGAHHPMKVNVRVIAASNRDLADMAAQGLFRQDLYFRLKVIPVALPPLRERPQDIIPLVAHGYRRMGVEPPPLPPTSWQQLLQHRWPGNVRELLNLVEQAIALDEDPANLLPLPPLPSNPVVVLGEAGEDEQIRQALDEHQGNAAAAARALGMSRSTLYRKLELYGIRLKRQIE